MLVSKWTHNNKNKFPRKKKGAKLKFNVFLYSYSNDTFFQDLHVYTFFQDLHVYQSISKLILVLYRKFFCFVFYYRDAVACQGKWTIFHQFCFFFFFYLKIWNFTAQSTLLQSSWASQLTYICPGQDYPLSLNPCPAEPGYTLPLQTV